MVVPAVAAAAAVVALVVAVAAVAADATAHFVAASTARQSRQPPAHRPAADDVAALRFDVFTDHATHLPEPSRPRQRHEL